ncbi:MAG TPA: hypothetical protein VGE12_02665 [Noviherbaspirillum sp.]
MAIPRTTAQKLVSESEFKLVNESFPPLVSSLSDKGLLQRMERARKARDKYHDQVERQQSKAASGNQRGTAPSTNLKEVISKEKLFEETLARFERQTARTGAGGGMRTDAERPARAVMGKKTASTKGGSQATSKASAKMANKAAAKTGTKADNPKTGKGTGGTMKATPRGRHGARTPSTSLH